MTTRFCIPAKPRVWTTRLPRRLPIRTRPPSPSRSPMRTSGWTRAVGRPLAGEARRRVVEGRIEERARGCRNQAERPFGIAVVDRRDMVGKRRQACVFLSDRLPIGAEMKLLVGLGEAVEKMTG